MSNYSPAVPEQEVSSEADLRGCELYIDCFSGIAGDMFLGAMVDLGVPQALIRSGLDCLQVSGYRLEIGRNKRLGLEGCDVKVRVEGGEHGYTHRRYRDILQMIERADLPGTSAEIAASIFDHVARAESRLHGVPESEISFHEVGAVDSIVDIVGAALCIDYLRPTKVRCRPVPLGCGWTECAHGRIPVPAPAAIEILRGKPVEMGGPELELCTPTGAAIVAALADDFGAATEGCLLAIGYGAGDAKISDRPNLLRLVALESPGIQRSDEVVWVCANLDDMNPEWSGYLAERLRDAGALDVWFSPIQMKKGRPGLELGVLIGVGREDDAISIILRESTALGVRHQRVARTIVERQWVDVVTAYGRVRIKEGMFRGNIVNAAPEFEDCRALAEQTGRPLKEIYAAALAVYQGRRE